MNCTSGLPHPCRQCLSCRINARRVWSSRIMLEAQAHEHSCFVTFTYSKEPLNGSVYKSHLSSTIHRLRERCREEDKGLRFFGVGEYGDISGRPHYHAALFGVGSQDRSLIEAAWHSLRDPGGGEAGFVHCGDLNSSSASYVSGYVTKKLVAGDKRLGNRGPEFAVMSRRPGIGMVWVQALVEGLNTSEGALYMARYKDVPVAFKIDGKLMPLGVLIRRYLRVFFFGDPCQPKAAKELNERRFYGENMPFVPLDASPTLRKIVTSKLGEQTAASHASYFEGLVQRGMNRAARHRIKNCSRTI